MKLLIVHFGDIHCHDGANVAAERFKQLPAAIQNLNVVASLVIASGAVAFSGKQEEDAIAQRDSAELLPGSSGKAAWPAGVKIPIRCRSLKIKPNAN